MKTRLLHFSALILLGIFVLSSPASAQIYTFGDTQNYWPGWNNGSGDDAKDTIGTPDFFGGSMTFTGSLLTGIQIDYAFAWNDSRVKFGDIFLNADGDGDWDYVVRTYKALAGKVDIFSVNVPLNGQGYLLSYLNTEGDNYPGSIRQTHPVAAGRDWLTNDIGDAAWSGWSNAQGSHSSSLTGLNLGYLDPQNLIIGFAASCANDVVYEQLNPVPVPAALWLLGSGIVGLVGLRRKKAMTI